MRSCAHGHLVTCRRSYAPGSSSAYLIPPFANTYLNAAEPKTPQISSPPDQLLEHTPVKPLKQLDGEIKAFLDKCRPTMQKLVQKALEVASQLPSWIGALPTQEIMSHAPNINITTITHGSPHFIL